MSLFQKIITFLSLILVLSCSPNKNTNLLKSGIWAAKIITQKQAIPFQLEIFKENGATEVYIVNGEEKLKMEEVRHTNDSLVFDLHIFDATIKAKIDNNELKGTFTKNFAEDYVLPFHATIGNNDLLIQNSTEQNFDGKWETTFTARDGYQYNGIGVFTTVNKKFKGTFLTKTGDYRYLNGYTKKDTMYLYTFDGNHIYKFKAVKENDSILKGQFWSGKAGYYTFTAKKNENATLPNAEKLTYLKDGYEKIDFRFPDLNGNMVSLSDKKYQNKVVILQILGTWCPNCMDETKFLANWYEKNSNKDVAIIGLAYENKKGGKFDLEYAKSRVFKMKNQLHANYDFVIAGASSTKDASKSLPMLSKVISFPTTIFIDKQGKVRKIHTGFSGPATGKLYQDFMVDFETFMEELLSD